MKRRTLIAALVVCLVGGPATAATDGTGFATSPCDYPVGKPLPGSGAVRRVPADFATIQSAVDAAKPGDTILISPGEYHESVKVRTDALRIRGTDRNGVVLNGKSTLQIGIDVTGPDHVVVENITAHHYTRHGFFWWHAHGYWGSHLTAYNNGIYGIYAFDSRCGQLNDSYASGNPDAGFYIGECFPCDAVITRIVAEQNALGYSGTNAGGNLLIKDSVWRDNGLGLVPNSLIGEDRPPQRGVTIKNNLIANNNNKVAPGVGIGGQYYGAGVVIAGGLGNVVAGNDIIDHELAGVALAPMPELEGHVWIPSGNTIWGNTVTHDASRYPDSLDLIQNAVSGPNNCWSDNRVGTTAPAELQTVWSCAHAMTPPGGDARAEASLLLGAAGLNGRTPSDWRTWPAAPAQQSQPDDDGDGDLSNDGAVDEWLPALL